MSAEQQTALDALRPVSFHDRVAELRQLAEVRPDQVRVWLQRHPRNLMIYCGWEPQWFHDEGFEHFLANPRTLWLAPRGSGKSTVAVFLAAWLGIAQPEQWDRPYLFEHAPRRIDPTNIRIALTSNSHPKACALLWQVKAIITSREIARLFGHLEGTRWKDEQADTRLRRSNLREPTYQALGLGSKVTGGHYDVVIADDWVTLDNARTELQRERIADFWAFTVKGTCEPWARVGVYGTRYHPKDFYGRIFRWASGDEEEARGAGPRVASKWAVLRHPAITYLDDGTRISYWPEYFPLDYLDETRDEIGSIAFATQYQNEVEGMLGDFFEASWLEHHRPWADVPADKREYALTCIALDPAFKGGPRNDWSVFSVVHFMRPKTFHVERIRRGRWTKHQLVEQATALHREHKPGRWAIEAIQGAEWLIQDLKKSAIPRGIIKAMPPRINKVGRADKVRALFETGCVWFDPPNAENQLQVAIDELLGFTGEKNGPSDDCVDSIVWNLIALSRGRSRLRATGVNRR